MFMRTFTPSIILQPYIKAFLIIETAQERINPILPGTAPVMALRFKGQVNLLVNNTHELLPVASLSGLRKTMRRIQYLPHSGNLLVQFRELGMSAFFKHPVHDFFEKSVAMNNLLPAQTIATLEEQLAAADSHTQRIAVAEAFFVQQLTHYKPDTLVMAALQKIHEHQGVLNMKALAGSLYISQDAFEKRFRKVAGTTPKQFASIARLQAATQRKEHQTLTDIAFEAGYFDQAHFNKEFKLFTGQTPTQFFQAPPQW